MGLNYRIRATAHLAAVACLSLLMKASPKQAEIVRVKRARTFEARTFEAVLHNLHCECAHARFKHCECAHARLKQCSTTCIVNEFPQDVCI